MKERKGMEVRYYEALDKALQLSGFNWREVIKKQSGDRIPIVGGGKWSGSYARDETAIKDDKYMSYYLVEVFQTKSSNAPIRILVHQRSWDDWVTMVRAYDRDFKRSSYKEAYGQRPPVSSRPHQVFIDDVEQFPKAVHDDIVEAMRVPTEMLGKPTGRYTPHKKESEKEMILFNWYVVNNGSIKSEGRVEITSEEIDKINEAGTLIDDLARSKALVAFGTSFIDGDELYLSKLIMTKVI